MYSKTIISSSFALAWQNAVKFVRKSSMDIEFGGGNEGKPALDSQTSILLDEHAIANIFAWNVHPSDPFGTKTKIAEYLKEYQAGFDDTIFDYTYRGRLERGFEQEKYSDDRGHERVALNQLDILKTGLEKQIDENLSSNRNIAILFNPEIENFSGLATPCLNEILIRYEGNNKVSIHTTFRSHDLFQAWESNIIAVLTMLNEEVVKPCGCTIKFLSEHNYSLHIYKHNLDAANNIKEVSINPQLRAIQTRYDSMGGSC
jgi:thymidylate synthase